MNRKAWLTGLVLALGTILSACNTQQTAVSPSPSKGTIQVELAFPTQKVGGVSASGVPWGATEAQVTIRDSSGSLITTLQLTPNNPSASATVPVGTTLSFETSVFGTDYSNSKVEIAWGQQSATVQDGDTVNLSVKGIISSISITPSTGNIVAGGTKSLYVYAYSPGIGGNVGPGDYTITCSATGGTCTTSGAGVSVTADPTVTSVTVDVTVTGLDASHNTAQFTDSATFTVVQPSSVADIGLSASVDNLGPNPGDTVTLTLTATNLGPIDMSAVSVNTTLPTGLTLQTVTTTAGTYDQTTGVWSVGTLAPGSSVTLTVTATVGANTSGQTLTFTATLDTTAVSPADTNASNDSASVNLYVGQTTGTVSVSGDLSPPWCFFQDPTQNSTVNIGTSVPIRINAYDSTDAASALTVDVYLGGDLIGSAVYNANQSAFELSWTPTVSQWGDQVLVAKVSDPAGNSDSCNLYVTVQ